MRLLLSLAICLFTNALAAQGCETVIVDAGHNTYAPTRERLTMARPPFPDDGDWEFGHDLIGSFFGLKVAGRYDRLSVSGLVVMGRAHDAVTVIGHVAPGHRVSDGPGGYPVFEHELTLNPDVAVRFEHRARGAYAEWVAVFE